MNNWLLNNNIDYLSKKKYLLYITIRTNKLASKFIEEEMKSLSNTIITLFSDGFKEKVHVFLL